MKYHNALPGNISGLFCALLVFFLFGGASLAGEQAETFTDPVTGMQFVLIPGGTFVMGKNSHVTTRPAHEVDVKPFYMGKYEVTFDEYANFVREKGIAMPDDNGWGRGVRPVINVNWHNAVAFAQWLSQKTGRTYRLPSEAEWEYAARATTNTHFYWGDQLGRGNANCRGCGSPWDDKMTAAVGSFPPNPFGLHDMAGNVYEWVLDTEHRHYNGAPVDGSAWIDTSPSQWRTTRGGSWNTDIYEITTTARCWDKPDYISSNVGFRLAMEN